MTAQIVMLVEGPTEEAFVSRVLQPYIGYASAYLTPIVVHTSRAADGTAFRGGGGWIHYHRQLQRLIGQPHWTLITTLVDYYGYPPDAPMCSCVGAHNQPACVTARQEAIRASLPHDDRFLPFLALHEFETLVIAAGASQTTVLGSGAVAGAFRDLVSSANGNAELINNGPSTAPSKRIAGIVDGYSKVRDGVAVLENGFESGLAFTPRFGDWVSILRDAGTDVAHDDEVERGDDESTVSDGQIGTDR
ncbi:DUF4276 family protein [Microbacterium flavum]|uniref:DUF4276 family protein n=1 Tax=Microbacterium flavum TaxID=415216 RepID=UPI0024ACEA53|nr:DUF4276 family protein [Microbacterium flavum]